MPSLSIYSKDASDSHRNTCSIMPTADEFMISRNQKQPRFSSTHELIKKMCHIYTIAIKKTTLLNLLANGWNSENNHPE